MRTNRFNSNTSHPYNCSTLTPCHSLRKKSAHSSFQQPPGNEDQSSNPPRYCDLLLNVLRENRTKQRFELHEFVIMRDHVHLILTPSSLVPLEKAIQFIKGGFSFRAKKEMHFNDEIWQKGYNEQRITHAHDYAEKATYIQLNPVKAGYVDHPEQFQYSSARLKSEIDPPPAHFQINPRG